MDHNKSPTTPAPETRSSDVAPTEEQTQPDKNEASGMKKLLSKTEKMNLLDSTKANEAKTKGTSGLGTVKMQEGGMMIAGRNVGAEHNEPDWTSEQKDFIRTMTGTTLQLLDVKDSRRSVIDEHQEYVGRDEGGSIVPTEEGYISALDTSEYGVGIGPFKYDITGSPNHYSDAVVARIRGDWMLNQWTSEWVVIEGVAADVFMKQHRVGAATQSNHRIGINFARIGLPKLAFGPLFNTLSLNYTGIMSTIIETAGYYWMNASWGVSSFAVTFAYMDEGVLKKTSNLSDVMRMLNGKSSLALAIVAISITCPSKMEGERQIPDRSSYGLSVKLHNAFGVNFVDYHGPPQQGPTGTMIPKRFITGAQSMRGSAGGSGGGGRTLTPTPQEICPRLGLRPPSPLCHQYSPMSCGGHAA
ncbi:hypothetical protein LTR74_017142 [Friedmanniomyces endolithicus]|nr:hypothetical protein LTR74_017142 [Friedmanniomyces endolithicus]